MGGGGGVNRVINIMCRQDLSIGCVNRVCR